MCVELGVRLPALFSFSPGSPLVLEVILTQFKHHTSLHIAQVVGILRSFEAQYASQRRSYVAASHIIPKCISDWKA